MFKLGKRHIILTMRIDVNNRFIIKFIEERGGELAGGQREERYRERFLFLFFPSTQILPRELYTRCIQLAT
ncbi:unnamed protein product [Arabidopsis halleri]